MQFNKYAHTHTHTHTISLIPPREDQCEWHRMTRMTGPDCVVVCNLINTPTHTHTHTHTHTQVSLIPPWDDQCEWHRMTRMTGPDCAVMCNLINIHTHTHTHTGCASTRASQYIAGLLVRPRWRTGVTLREVRALVDAGVEFVAGTFWLWEPQTPIR